MLSRKLLDQARHIDNQINCKMEQAVHLRRRMEQLTELRTAGQPNRRLQLTSLLLENLELEIVEDMQRLVRLQMRIAGLIDQVEVDIYRTLLTYRYFNNWTWERIADEMHYSIQHIYRLRHLSLEHIHKKMR